jgi:putative transposase
MYETDRRLKVALFRHGVIAPLVCRKLDPDAVKELRKRILEQPFEHPDGSLRTVPERTVRHWLQKYRKHGFKGLFDEFRSDRGKCKAIPDDLLQKAEELRREEPGRSVRTIMEILKQLNIATGSLRERTVARQLTVRGATKKLLKKGAGSYRRWEQLHANDLWHGDTSHGIWLRDPENPNKAKKTKFIVFVDDASRLCTHGEFYLDEQLPRLLDCFGKALLKNGRPCRLLFDNAFIYHSTSMATMCAELGSEISFCRPRAPQGKGKVERFIKTVQDSFMTEANRAGVQSLHELNAMFNGWLENYHNRLHSELDGKTPKERWKEDMARISLVTEAELRRALMLRATRKVHINTATVSVDGKDYQASTDLAGQEVEVRWHPQQTESVELWMLGEFIEVAPAFRIKPWVEPRAQQEKEDAPGTPTASSKMLMQSLQANQSDDSVVPINSSNLLACTEFVKLFRDALERELVQEELNSLGVVFARLAPLRRDVVATSLQRSIQVKGGELHLRFYLEQLEQALRRR